MTAVEDPASSQLKHLMQLALASPEDAVPIVVGGRQRNLVVKDPRHVRHVMAVNKGNYTKETGPNRQFRADIADGILTAPADRWHAQRRVLGPVFADTGYLDRVVREHVADLVRELADAARTGTEVDLTAAMSKVTLTITIAALFGFDDRALSRALERCMAVFDAAGSTLPSTETIRECGAMTELFAVVRAEVAQVPPSRRGPALAQLLCDPGHAGEQLYHQIVTLLMAGFETTANSLAWTWICLMNTPDVYHAWRQRLVSGADDAAAWTGSVFDETLRLYPSSWIIGRRAIADDRIGDYPVPAGSVVTVSPYLVHRNPAFWPEPEQFRPERFRAPAKMPHPAAFIPFGAGPRFCIGHRFARVEASTILSELGRRFVFAAPPSAPAEPKFQFVLRAPYFPVTVHE